jgi:MFS family permease
MEVEKKKGIHYAWFVLIGCCLVFGGTVGIFFNCAGIFFDSITSELGFGIPELSFWFTTNGIAASIALPFVGRTLPKVNVRVLMTVCAAVQLTAYGLMSTYTEPWMWWISGAFIGGLGAFVMFVPIPVILSQWFAKKTGLAIGIAMSCAGIVGAVLNPVLTALIQNPEFGWRKTYLVALVIGAVMVLPSTIFIIRFKPSDKGLKPYGYEEQPAASAAPDAGQDVIQTGVFVKDALKSPSFYLLTIAFALSSVFANITQLFPTFAAGVGFDVTVGATMVSAVMVMTILFSFAFGAVSDRFGSMKSTVLSLVLVVVSYVLLLICTGNVVLALIGAALGGIASAFYSAGVPIVVRSVYGNRDYGKIFSYLSITMTLVGAFGLTILSFLSGALGGFNNLFLVCIGGMIFILILIVCAFRSAKKLPSE